MIWESFIILQEWQQQQVVVFVLVLRYHRTKLLTVDVSVYVAVKPLWWKGTTDDEICFEWLIINFLLCVTTSLLLEDIPPPFHLMKMRFEIFFFFSFSLCNLFQIRQLLYYICLSMFSPNKYINSISYIIERTTLDTHWAISLVA